MAYYDHYPMPTSDTAELIDQTCVSKKSIVDSSCSPRQIDRITGLVLHCTGSPPARWGNDPYRYRNVNAHFVITPNGTIAHNHEPSAYLHASHYLNSFTVAVEFVGNFRSERNKWNAGDRLGRDHLTHEQVMSGRWLFMHCASAYGITQVFTHRQSRTGKVCSGPDVWYHVGQWAVDRLGASDGGPGYHVQGGAAIPDAWRKWNRVH